LKSRRCEALAAALAVGLAASRLSACGPNFPNNLLDRGDQAVLLAPVADFHRELARMNLPAPRFQSVPATNGYEAQTLEADLAELRAALKPAKSTTKERNDLVQRYAAEREKLMTYEAAVEAWEANGGFDWSSGKPVSKRETDRPNLSAVQVVEGLPEEFADYFRGSIAWHAGSTNEAKAAWEALLALPESERHYRSTWAAYMLGRLCGDAEPDTGITYLQQVRALAKAGFADSVGLAAASIGWEARLNLRQKKFERAIELYLEQMAAGDDSAVNSLRFAAAQALNVGTNGLGPLAANAHTRRVITAYLISTWALREWSALAGSDRQTDPTSRVVREWLAAVEAAGVQDIESAEQLALAAYQAGQWDLAQRWIMRARSTPATQWLQAKLLLRAGRIDEAAVLLALVTQSFPIEPPDTNQLAHATFEDSLFVWDTDEGLLEPEHMPAGRQVLGELGVLHLARREYVQALDALLRSGFWMDAAYVAERVLTVDELQTYVVRDWPAVTNAQFAAEIKADAESKRVVEAVQNSNWDEPERPLPPPMDTRQKIRYVLARRLTRLGRGHEAREFYPAEWQPRLDALLQALATGRDKSLPAEQRFKVLFAAAMITRTNGMELIGTEVGPDWHIHDGNYTEGVSVATRTNEDFKLLPASADELGRAAQHKAVPEERFRYRYLAAALRSEASSLAWEAAKLMPDNSEETARVLCQAGLWLDQGDQKTAGTIYRAMIQRCRNTEIGAEAARTGLFPRLDESGRVILRASRGEQHPTPGKPYVVNAGDTLFHIAKVLNAEGRTVTVQAIVQANPGLNADKIRAGQVIQIPAPNSNLPQPTQLAAGMDGGLSKADDNDTVAEYPVPGKYYFIHSGDSLADIAQAAGVFGQPVTVQDLLEANPGLAPDQLKIGQRIMIPAPDMPLGQSPPIVDTNSLPPHASSNLTALASSGYSYVVRSGDSLASIARDFAIAGVPVTVRDIVEANPGLDGARLKVGQTLIIPSGKK
jgi:LysM repeat protein